jgi:hypothetical protein
MKYQSRRNKILKLIIRNNSNSHSTDNKVCGKGCFKFLGGILSLNLTIKCGNYVNRSKNCITQIGLMQVTFVFLKTNLIQKP